MVTVPALVASALLLAPMPVPAESAKVPVVDTSLVAAPLVMEPVAVNATPSVSACVRVAVAPEKAILDAAAPALMTTWPEAFAGEIAASMVMVPAVAPPSVNMPAV